MHQISIEQTEYFRSLRDVANIERDDRPFRFPEVYIQETKDLLVFTFQKSVETAADAFGCSRTPHFNHAPIHFSGHTFTYEGKRYKASTYCWRDKELIITSVILN